MAFPFWERKTLTCRAKCSRYLGLYTVFYEEIAVISRTSYLVFVVATVCFIVYIKLTCGGHQQQRADVGTANTTEIHMRIARKKHVMKLVGR